jgi:glycosyltransferase involved in cell wall biosynthesis
MTAPDLSVVIPAFNEFQRLGHSLTRIVEYVDAQGVDAEIVVVDDGSTDGTGDLARSHLASRRASVISNTSNRGKGFAVRRGVLDARGRTVLITDADLSCPIEEHQRLARAMCDRNLDVAIGSRSLPQSRIEVRQHLGRELMGKTFNGFVRALTGMPYGDTQCGFKLLKAARARQLFERMTIDGFAFDVELLLLCARDGLRVGEVPVVWRNSRDSHVSLFGDSMRMLFDLGRLVRRSAASRPPVSPEA